LQAGAKPAEFHVQTKPWASKGFFPRVGKSGFFQVVAKSIFQQRINSGEISFLETKRKNIFLIKC